MRILLDNGVPRGVAAALSEHIVEEARGRGWDLLKNGELLEAAERDHFDLFVTTDKNLSYQQNLTARKIAILVLGKGRWKLIRPRLDAIALAVNGALPASFTEVEIPDR